MSYELQVINYTQHLIAQTGPEHTSSQTYPTTWTWSDIPNHLDLAMIGGAQIKQS